MGKRPKVGAIAFPELFLFGYPVFDIIARYPKLVEKNIEYLEKLAKCTGKTKVLIGFCEFNRFYMGKRYFNSVAVLFKQKNRNHNKKDAIARLQRV